MDKILWVSGVVVALVIAHFYYRLTLRKSISFFLLLDDRPLSHVNPDVRSRLKVNFFAPDPAPEVGGAAALVVGGADSIAVGELQHLQVIVANTGTRAIQFAEAPTISLPSKHVILDASIIYQRPHDLGATLTRLPVIAGAFQKVQLTAPLLNKGECFIAKFLISDSVEAGALELHLLSEDLPRTVKIEALAAQSTKTIMEAVEWPAVIIGALLLVLCANWLFVSTTLYRAHLLPSILDVGALQFFRSLGLVHIELLISVLGATLLGLFGVVLCVGIGLEPMFKLRRIVLPPEFRPSAVLPATSKDGQNPD